MAPFPGPTLCVADALVGNLSPSTYLWHLSNLTEGCLIPWSQGQARPRGQTWDGKPTKEEGWGIQWKKVCSGLGLSLGYSTMGLWMLSGHWHDFDGWNARLVIHGSSLISFLMVCQHSSQAIPGIEFHRTDNSVCGCLCACVHTHVRALNSVAWQPRFLN